MITELIDDSTVKKAVADPKGSHWPQSPLERVSDARVLLSGGDFALVRTEFLAPKLVRHATWRTEDIGETSRRISLLHTNLAAYANISRWFHQLVLPESYEQGDFPHEDYTLWAHNRGSTAFVNLRRFPPGSYLLDLISAGVGVYNEAGEKINAGHVSSYSGGAESNDALKPSQRTETLEQLARQNRIRQGRIVAQTSEGEYESHFKGDGPITLLNYADFPNLPSLDADEGLMGAIHAADRSEIALQNVLTHFKSLLEECCIPYRKE